MKNLLSSFHYHTGPLSIATFLFVLWFLLSPRLVHAQWAAIGPNGGGAHLVAEDSAQPGTIIAGTRNALLYRSSDHAQTWQPIAFERSLTATLNTLVTNRCFPGSFLIGTTDSEVSKAGLYQLTQVGESWQVSSLL